jgi:hypothetical protein
MGEVVTAVAGVGLDDVLSFGGLKAHGAGDRR